jgi:hypothetical protein
MAKQLIMDHTGDRQNSFDKDNPQALARAERRFKELIGLGFTAAVRTTDGYVSRIQAFDPTADETLFFPRLVGG